MKTGNNNLSSIFAALSGILLLLVSCSKQAPSDLTRSGIIPKPVSMTATGDYFLLKTGSNIFVSEESREIKVVAQYLAAQLTQVTGVSPEISSVPVKAKRGNIYLSLASDSIRLGDEGYNLTISARDLKLTARSPAGLFRGIQTIRQLLPASTISGTDHKGPWKIPTGIISDRPIYAYRGAMLDVSRHFFSAEDVKKYIDEISFYKMNILHLHLSDDQGWRIEIKSWPNLANHGGSTQVGGSKGGFYTQEQYKDIVKYAGERFVIIVPEIDMPGHTNAALASYPELNCNNKARELYTGTEVGFSTLCTKKPVVFNFIDSVIKELAALTPGPYIHIGGDESLSTKMEDYIPFMEEVQKIVSSYGKQVIAWDEIANSKILPGTVAQCWANYKNASEAVKKGAKILMSPAAKAYLDMQYDSTSKFGLHWAGYVEVDSGYLWDPAKLIPEIGRESILGVEAPLWSETVSTLDEVEYLAFPRLPGIAEIGWTPASLRDWNDYKIRLASHGERMKAMGIDFYHSKKISWNKIQNKD